MLELANKKLLANSVILRRFLFVVTVESSETSIELTLIASLFERFLDDLCITKKKTTKNQVAIFTNFVFIIVHRQLLFYRPARISFGAPEMFRPASYRNFPSFFS